MLQSANEACNIIGTRLSGSISAFVDRMNERAALLGILAEDPRPAYQDDPEREYGFGFAGKEIRFRVENGRLKVTDIH